MILCHMPISGWSELESGTPKLKGFFLLIILLSKVSQNLHIAFPDLK